MKNQLKKLKGDEAEEGEEEENQEEKTEIEEEKEKEKKEIEINKSKIKQNSAENSKTPAIKEDKFDWEHPVVSFFKNVEIVKNESKISKEDMKKKYGASYGMFYCDSKYSDEIICDQQSLLSCPNCMKLNQKLYGLKPHYLINDKGRVCTYKKNIIYCNGKFFKEDQNNEYGITFSYEYICGHSGQCDACRRLTKLFDKYFDKNLLDKLRKRDEV